VVVSSTTETLVGWGGFVFVEHATGGPVFVGVGGASVVRVLVGGTVVPGAEPDRIAATVTVVLGLTLGGVASLAGGGLLTEVAEVVGTAAALVALTLGLADSTESGDGTEVVLAPDATDDGADGTGTLVVIVAEEVLPVVEVVAEVRSDERPAAARSVLAPPTNTAQANSAATRRARPGSTRPIPARSTRSGAHAARAKSRTPSRPTGPASGATSARRSSTCDGVGRREGSTHNMSPRIGASHAGHIDPLGAAGVDATRFGPTTCSGRRPVAAQCSVRAAE
jgi:hypothetical protein